MPRLPAPQAKQAAEAAAQGGSFAAIDAGIYTGRLAKVKASVSKVKPEGGGGNPMWELEFDEVKDLDGKRQPGRQFTNLVIVDTAMWKVGQFFAAYCVPEETDTDELIGHRIRLVIGKRVIAVGQRAGQEGNDINGFNPLDPDDEGYAASQKLATKLGGGAKATKAAPAKAAAKEAAETGEQAAAEVASSGDDNDADF